MPGDYLSIARSIVLKNIRKDQYAVFLFGSRARNNAAHGADIDIGIWGLERISSQIINKIVREIEDSVVPYNVDLIDFYLADEYFKQIALKSYLIWNLPAHLKLKF